MGGSSYRGFELPGVDCNFTLDISNSRLLELFSVSLEGSNYRESTVHLRKGFLGGLIKGGASIQGGL